MAEKKTITEGHKTATKVEKLNYGSSVARPAGAVSVSGQPPAKRDPFAGHSSPPKDKK